MSPSCPPDVVSAGRRPIVPSCRVDRPQLNSVGSTPRLPQFFARSKLKESNWTAENGENEASAVDKDSGVEGEVNGTAAVLTEDAIPLKSPITLIRCDGYMCERESVQSSDIKFRGAATEQVTTNARSRDFPPSPPP